MTHKKSLVVDGAILFRESVAELLSAGPRRAGKRIVAKSIHYRGNNRNGPFIETNCAALPENLLEAELFGYEKGAFTGAVTAQKGIQEKTFRKDLYYRFSVLLIHISALCNHFLRCSLLETQHNVAELRD